MINLNYDEVVEKIVKETGKSKEEVEKLIEEKINELSGLVSRQGAAHIVANELGVKVVKHSDKLNVKNIVPGMRNVEITGKVVRKYEVKNFETPKRSGRVASLLLGDETGMIRVVLWDDMVEYFDKIEEGMTIKIINAYSRENRNRREIHLTTNSKIVIDTKEEINVKKPKKVSLKELTGNEQDIEVYATIVQVFDPRFFEVCPSCGKRLRMENNEFVCPTHGVVEPDYRIVLNVFIDDGTENLRLVIWEPQLMQMLKKSHEELISLRNNREKIEELKNELLGRIIRVIGRANKNEAFDRIEVIANRIELDPKPPEE